MSTTEDYLDQLLRSASGEGSSVGESEVQSEDNLISLDNNTGEMALEDGISLEDAMEMSVDDVLNEMESMEVNQSPEAEDELEMGMLSEEAIAAMFADSELPETETEPEVPIEEEVVEVSEAEIETAVETEPESEEIGDENPGVDMVSFDDMLAGIAEEDVDTFPEDVATLSEETTSDLETEDEGNDSILDLLNLMADDEDLKDIGDLLKADENSEFDISDEELFGDVPNEGEEEQAEEKGEKQGFFAKLFGKKKNKSAEMVEGDENQQIIEEVEEEIKEEEKKAEEQEEKKKKKKAKKDKKAKKKGKADKEAQGEGEESETQDGKKAKKEKKKKVKKEKPPKEVDMTPKEPPLPKKPVILIMLMAASILALVLLSHNLINYQSNINKADGSFINRKYEEAYQNILGVKVKEDDKLLYDRIRVMMKMEAKYEMYLLHIEQNKYDEALNDLIMGVIKYDQYQKDAEELGIQQAFADELTLIEEQLNVVFGVDANQAREWYNTLSDLDYTETVRNVVKAAGYSIEEPIVEETEDNTEDLSQFGVEAVE